MRSQQQSISLNTMDWSYLNATEMMKQLINRGISSLHVQTKVCHRDCEALSIFLQLKCVILIFRIKLLEKFLSKSFTIKYLHNFVLYYKSFNPFPKDDLFEYQLAFPNS